MISFIVPVFNHPSHTKVCLDRLLAHAPGCEIIVVDNGSLPKTKSILTSYGDRISVITSEENRGTAWAYQAGLQKASHERVVFMHNDCMVPASLMRALSKTFSQLERPDCRIGVATPMTSYTDERTFVVFEVRQEFMNHKPSNKSKPTVEEVEDAIRKTYREGLDAFAEKYVEQPLLRSDETSSFFMACLKSFAVKIGGFNEEFKWRGFEDQEFLARVRMSGKTSGRAGLFVHHFGNITSDGFGLNSRQLKESNKPVFERLLTIAGGCRRQWSAVLFPDMHPELTIRARVNLAALEHPPEEIIEIPRPGIFPEREAWKWALPQVTTEFVMQFDADMLLERRAPHTLLTRLMDPDLACAAALLEDPCVGPVGHVKMWRTAVLQQITFGEREIRPIHVDVEYADAAEQMGWKFRRINEVVGKHAIVLEPWTVFRAYFRRGIKQRVRARIGTPAATWGIEGAMGKNSPWSHIALLGFHCGIQVDYDGDPHDSRWDEFAYGAYLKVKLFCEGLAANDNQKIGKTNENKILVLLASSSFLVGGIEQNMLTMAETMDKDKFEVAIGFEGQADPILTDRARRQGIKCVDLGSPSDAGSAWYACLKTMRPDVIVTFLRSSVYQAAQTLDIPMIERTPGWNGHSGVPKNIFEKVVVQYELFRRELLAKSELLAREGDVELIYNPVDTVKFAPRDTIKAKKKLGTRPGALVLGTVSRVNPVKNISFQINGLRELLSRGIDAELHVVGRASTPDEVEEKDRLIEAAGDMKGRVIFHGAVADPAEVMAAFDVVLLTSITEGVPNCLLEAMSMRKQVVTTDVGGIRELMQSKATYVPKDDAKALADAVIAAAAKGDADYDITSYTPTACARKWGSVIEQVYLRKNEVLPYEDDSRIHVALLCNTLELGGMEAFIRVFDKYVDRRRFDVHIYSREPGPLLAKLKSKVRICNVPSEFSAPYVRQWIHDDRIDVAIVVTYRGIQALFDGARSCRVIERADGNWMKLGKSGLVDAVVLQSECMTAMPDYDEFSAPKRVVINNGRELEEFKRDTRVRNRLRTELGLADDDCLIANVGRLAPQKNQGKLIELAHELAKRGKRFKIAIMGPDWGVKQELQDQIKRLEVERHVILMEASADGPRALLSAADIYVHPSLYEGLSGAIVEACAAGLPVIASDAGATGDIVDGSNGELIPLESIDSLPDVVSKFIDDPALASRAGSKSLEKSVAFDGRAMVRKYEELIEQEASLAKTAAEDLPLITVVMPVWNRVKFMREAIDSVVAQTSPEWRLIIAIDTTEPSAELMQVIESYQDKRISYVKSPHKNPSAAINNAVRSAKTKYCSRLDSDDRLHPTAIETMNKAIKANPDVGYFYTGRTYVDDFGMPWTGSWSDERQADDFSPILMERRYIAKHLITWRNVDFVQAGGFPEDIIYGEDYLFALMAMLRGTKFMPIKSPLYEYRMHQSGNICSNYNNNEKRFFYRTIRERYAKLKKILGISWAGEDPGTIEIEEDTLG